MIIGICGVIGSGKDTIADYLCNFEGFRRESFAATLKDAVSAVFGWDRTLLEGRTKHAREWREQVDPWWADRLDIPNLTPRWVLQFWGTEVCRKAFHDDIWIASLENKLRSSKDDIVISDCRFPNEIKAIKNQNGMIVWVQRGSLPDWYKTAVLANCGDKSAQCKLEQIGIHVSETAWAGTEFDHIVDNNDSIQHLCDQVKSLVKNPELNLLSSAERPLYIGLVRS
jgi:hypothetical protein